MKNYDVTFIGHMCYDEITYPGREPVVNPGSAVLCGAMAAVHTGKKIAAVVKLARKDEIIVQSMQEAGIEVYIIPAKETTYSRVIHASMNMDERELVLVKDSGRFSIEDIPEIKSRYIHLAGISNREFDIDFIREIHKNGSSLSVDMQSFVRQVDEVTRKIAFSDVENKEELVSYFDKVKLDIVEARILTGEDDIEKAARIIASWGTREVIITQSDGILAYAEGAVYYEKFSHISSIGRTGRGDTAFAAYLCRRIDYSVRDSLKFAAALVSVKMENHGPFNGSIDEVIKRMEEAHRG